MSELEDYGQVFINDDIDSVTLIDVNKGAMLTPLFFGLDNFECSATEHLELFIDWLNAGEGAHEALGRGIEHVHDQVAAFTLKTQEAFAQYSLYEGRIPLRSLEEYWDVIKSGEDINQVISMWLREAECDQILEELDPTDLARRLEIINDGSVMGSIAYDESNTIRVQLTHAVLYLHRNDDTTYNLTIKDRSPILADANVLATESNVSITRIPHQVTQMFASLDREQSQSVRAKTPRL